MEKVYYYIATENFITLEEVKNEYKIFNNGESFAEWLNNALFGNNGELQEVDNYFNRLVREYNTMDGTDDWFDFGCWIFEQIDIYATLAKLTENEKTEFESKIMQKMK